MKGLLIALVLTAAMALVIPVLADSSRTQVVPASGKYPIPALQVNDSMEPVILNQGLGTVDQSDVYLIPSGSVILMSDDGIDRVFSANGTQFLAVYDNGAQHTHVVPNGAFVDSEGNITYVLSGNLPVETIIDATSRGMAPPTPAPLVASFSPMPEQGNPPLNIQFSDYSQGTITGWNWSFGDGSGSTGQYPVHTYQANGTYNVSLTVSGPSGSDTFTWPGCITVGPRPPLARIGADPQRADYAPLTVTFTDTSAGDITGRLWDFGDGITSAEQNPVHTYRKQGNYSVSLTVSGPAGTSTLEESVFILVGPFKPVADFEVIYTPGPAPCSVEFQQYSSGTVTQWFWDFGDGTKSSDKKPVHTYQRNGNFTVNLTVTGPEGISTKTRPSLIHVGEPFFIHADPVTVHSIGEIVTLTGDTNLPSGEELDYSVFTSAFNPGGPQFGNPSNASGITRVVQGKYTNNSWSVSFDTKDFRPDEYFVDLQSTTFTDVESNFRVTIIKGKRPTGDNPDSALVTSTGNTSIAANGTPAPTTQPAPLSVMITLTAVGGLLVVAGLKKERRSK